MQLCNDPRNSRLTPNTELSEYGWLRVTHARVPAFDLDKTLEENSGAELRWDYTDEYWDYHEALGTSNEPIDVD